MHHAEFEVGRFLNVRPGFRRGGFGKSGQLNADAIVAFRLNHRLGDAKAVHAFAQHVDGLRQRGGRALRIGDLVRVQFNAVGVNLDEEGRAAREVNAELDAPGGFALEAVQYEGGGTRLVLAFKKRKVRHDVVRADGFLQVGVGAVGARLLQFLRAAEDFVERLVALDRALAKLQHEVAIGHRREFSVDQTMTRTMRTSFQK